MGVKSAKDLIKLALKNTKVAEASILSKSTLFNKTVTKIGIPMMNVAFSGDLDGGMTSGILTIAGPSKTFKSLFGLMLCSFYLKEHPESIMVFLDSEFGSRPAYFDKWGIDKSRVIHMSISDLEQFRFEMVRMLEAFKRGDKVIFLVDSIGNLASLKETQDAIEGNVTVDMTRAKVIRSIHRIITTRLNIKDLLLIEINHIYDAMDNSKAKVVSGGAGGYYASDDVWIVSRQQVKEKVGNKEVLVGWNFTITVDKSRSIAEKTKFDFTVYMDSGMDRYSGIFEEALEAKFIITETQGFYQMIDLDTGEVLEKKWRRSAIEETDYLARLVENNKFKEFIRNKYNPQGKLLQDDTKADAEFLTEEENDIAREDDTITSDI